MLIYTIEEINNTHSILTNAHNILDDTISTIDATDTRANTNYSGSFRGQARILRIVSDGRIVSTAEDGEIMISIRRSELKDAEAIRKDYLRISDSPNFCKLI